MIDELIKLINSKPFSIFCNDEILVKKTILKVNVKLEIGWDTLKSKIFWLSRTKT